MPEPIKSSRRYMPGLDGLRALAVLGVIGYHLGIDALPGGLLGVSVFFTLSGYLITDLLLTQFGSGEFRLSGFWIARARRLLPALFGMLIVVTAWVTVIGPHQTSDFRVAAGTAALYVNNWWLVFRDISYFAQFEAPGPLNHLWSLSIEEQFYIVWPLILLGAARLIRERRARFLRPRLALGILALGAVSFATMMLLHVPGLDPSRVYYGTDTRAAELLVGASLAAVWPSQRLRTSITDGARNLIDAAGTVGLALIVLMFVQADAFSTFLYRGGFVLLSIAVATVVASVAHPASRLGPLVGCRPLRWIGARSYGIYLWHFPIIVLTTPAGSSEPGLVLAAVQVAATFAIAALSWRFVEDPIRHGALGRAWADWRAGSLRRDRLRLTPTRGGLFAGSTVVLVVALAGFAGAGVEDNDLLTDDEIAINQTVTADPNTPTAATATTTAVTGDATPGPCTSVVFLGGSTSLGLLKTAYIADEADQLPAQLTRVGVTTQHYEIAGGRSILERHRDSLPAVEAAQKWADQGFDGCWIFALGTNDVANVGVGGSPGFDERIDAMMAVAAGDPVLWFNVRTVATSGAWRAELMPAWNDALRAACARHPNMRVYDWASEVQDDWFEPDGIHNNPAGHLVRSRNTADALAKAFAGPGAPGHHPTAGEGCEFGL